MACPANLADTLQINNPGCSRLHQCVVSTLTASLGSADAHRLQSIICTLSIRERQNGRQVGLHRLAQ